MFDTRGSGGPGPSPGTGVPVWTKTPPTVPGLYWFKLRINEDYPPPGFTRFCRVVARDGRLILGSKNYDAHDHLDVEGLQRWWAGPLLEPTEE